MELQFSISTYIHSEHLRSTYICAKGMQYLQQAIFVVEVTSGFP